MAKGVTDEPVTVRALNIGEKIQIVLDRFLQSFTKARKRKKHDGAHNSAH